VGRPNAYEEIIKPNLDRIRELVAKGMTNNQIARIIGVSPSTLYKYKAEYMELKENYKKGIDEKIVELEETAYSVATGKYEAITEDIVYNADGDIVSRKVKRVKQVDTTALIFMLKALKPEMYANLEPDDNKDVVKAIQDLSEKLT
jgi:predicted transcriptional regulator